MSRYWEEVTECEHEGWYSPHSYVLLPSEMSHRGTTDPFVECPGGSRVRVDAPSDEMVERAAEALHDSEQHKRPVRWADLNDGRLPEETIPTIRTFYRNWARAALSAALFVEAPCATCGGSRRVREYDVPYSDALIVESPCPDCWFIEEER